MKHDKLTQAILAKANTMPAAWPFPTKDRPGIKVNKPKAWAFPTSNFTASEVSSSKNDTKYAAQKMADEIDSRVFNELRQLALQRGAPNIKGPEKFTPAYWPQPTDNILSPNDDMYTKLAKECSPNLVFTGEKDPNGKDLNSPGAKADAGKTRGWLCLAGFSRALEEVAKVTTVGANKYTPNGWVDVPDGPARYMDAFVRHALALGQGEVMDDGTGGTGCYHKAQMIWNLLAAFELELREST